MRKLKKTKLLPLFTLIIVMGMMLFAVPLTASADEPLEDDWYYDEHYDEYYDEYYGGYAEGLPYEDIVELPDEYYGYGGTNAFTPDGTGTVIDNATDGDGKEFYTIETPDGNVFYLVIDRQRSTDNVYFLGAVTEQDLMSLAQIQKKPETEAAATFPGNIEAAEEAPADDPPESQAEAPAATAASKDDMMLYAIIGVAVIGIGGAGYYIKIVKPKKDGTSAYEDDYGEDYGGDDDDNGYENDDNDGYDDDEEDDFEDENGYEDEADVGADDSNDTPVYDPYGDSSSQAQQHNPGNGQSSQNSRRKRRRRKRRNTNYNK